MVSQDPRSKLRGVTANGIMASRLRKRPPVAQLALRKAVGGLHGTRQCLLALLFLVSCCLSAAPSVAAAPSEEEVTPAHVYALVSLFREELDLVRVEMGRPKERRPLLQVRDAAPREVYFQALALFQRANRLSFEMTRWEIPEPTISKERILPADVRHVVNLALERLRYVEESLGLRHALTLPPIETSRTPTDVFRSIVQAGRQLNLLLDRRFSSSDVFQQVTQALGYASGLRANFAGRRMPATQPFVRAKTPAQVFEKLLDCFRLVRRIAAESGVGVLELRVSRAELEAVSPADMHSMASLLVSELRYLHSKLPKAPPPRQAYYPGKKLPSHVFQRAGLLEAQLKDIAALVKTQPGWLAQGP